MSENTGKNIKTRETKHDVKVLDKSAEMAKSLKRTAVKAKDQVRNLADDGQITPEEYAEDKVRYAAENTASEAKHQVKKTEKNVRDRFRSHQEKKQKEKLQKELDKDSKGKTRKTTKAEKKADSGNSVRPKVSEPSVEESGRTTVQQREYGVQQHEARMRGIHQKNASVRTAEQTSKTAVKQTAKSTGKATAKTAKGTVKTTQKTVKTAKTTSKVAIKTSKAAASATQKAAQAAAKAAKQTAILIKKAAVTAYKAAVVIGKAIVAAVKAMIAAIKELIAAIAAGGWVAVVIIIAVALLAVIIATVCGIFLSSEDTGSETTMQEVVREINEEYQYRIEEIKADNTYDEIEMSGSSAVWREVLSIYAVKVNTDPENPKEVATLNQEKIMTLTEIFWEMNDIQFRTETKTEAVIVESDDGRENITEEEVEETHTILFITVSHKTAEEAAELYGFTDDQKEMLEFLLDEKNRSLWAAVLYGIHSAGDTEIVEVALSQIGNVGGQPYWSWYGFGSRVEWCACFVSWCANECGYIENGIIPKYAGCGTGMDWFRERDQWINGNEEPLPGMIIFYDWDDPDGSAGPQDGNPDHTGIVEKVVDGTVYTVEGNTYGDSCQENHVAVGHYEILGYGVPAY